jgi:hypothetical protein
VLTYVINDSVSSAGHYTKRQISKDLMTIYNIQQTMLAELTGVA